jgi:hypothetical protein
MKRLAHTIIFAAVALAYIRPSPPLVLLFAVYVVPALLMGCYWSPHKRTHEAHL